MTRAVRAVAAALLLSVAHPLAASAADRYALIVSGASGGAEFAIRFDYWRLSIASVLRARYGYPDDHLIELSEDAENAARKATRENVRAAFDDLRRRVSKDDVLLILLIGHGTATDADDAKFNLVGPDLSAGEWEELVRPIPGRVVFIDAASGSFPFLQKLAARGRIIVTSTDALGHQAEALFPEFFFAALIAAEADTDKDGKISVWEAFAYASRQIRDWFQQRGQLPTQRPLLDDRGEGVGREADEPGAKGSLAQVTYIDRERSGPAGSDPASSALAGRRAAVAAEMERLRARKEEMPLERYNDELEKLLVELARIDRQLRAAP